MNTFNIKLTIIGAFCLSFWSPVLRAVQLEPDQVGSGSTQTVAELFDDSRRVYGKEVIVTWSEANDEIRGFSHKTGDWDVIKIAPQKEIVPSVSQNMVAVRICDSVAAFSGEKCRWDVIELSRDSKAQPIIGDSLVQIEDNGHLYTFAAEKASWTSPTDVTLREASEKMGLEIKSSSQADYYRKLVRLEKEFRKWSDSLPRYKKNGMLYATFTSGQQRTIEFSVARQRWMPELKSKVEELCRLVEASDSTGGFEEDVDSTTPNAVATDLEEQIAALQVKLNTLRTTTPEVPEAATKQPDKATLRPQVEQAFDVRQQLQELEAQKLRLKLQLIEANLNARQKNRDGIIERRVQELLTSGFDSSSKPKAGNSATHNVELLVFTASYCGPCQQMTPILTRLTRDKFPVRILDITTETEQTRRFKIERIPTFVVTIDGQESRRFIGVQSETELRRAMNVSDREADSEKVTHSPIGLPYSPGLPDANAETVRPFQNDPNPASATGPAIIQNAAAAMTWKQPSEIISELRNVHTEVESRRRHQSQMKERMGRFTEKKKSATPGSDEYARIEGEIKDLEEETSLFTQANMEEMMRRWTQPWSEYQTQVRLLRLDVDAAKVSFELKRIPHQQKIDANKKYKSFSDSEIEIAAAEEQQSKISLQRAEEILRLYTDIEKNEPQLNPDYEAPPAEEATDAKPE